MADLGHSPASRLAMIVARFRGCPDDEMIAAVAIGDSGAVVLTHGDLRALADALGTAEERLGQIGDWHARETAPGGLVGGYCVECGKRWPCDTSRMVDGTYVDEEIPS